MQLSYSSKIAKRIRALAGEKAVPVLAFVEDVAASGGYWLATAGDEIYADESSIIGSIGVITAGFGFTDLLQRIGIERRVHTAGPRKAMLDPFSAEQPEDVANDRGGRRRVVVGGQLVVDAQRPLGRGANEVGDPGGHPLGRSLGDQA